MWSFKFRVLLFKTYVCQGIGNVYMWDRNKMIIGLVVCIHQIINLLRVRSSARVGRSHLNWRFCILRLDANLLAMLGVKCLEGEEVWLANHEIVIQFNLHGPSHHLWCFLGEKNNNSNQIKALLSNVGDRA